MKRTSSLCFLMFLLLLGKVEGQTTKAYQKAASKAMNAHDYYAAMEYTGMALEKNPENIALQYQYAEAARHFQAFELASESYQKVLASPSADQFAEARFYLAEVERSQGHYEAASKEYHSFLSSNPSSESLRKRAQNALEQCDWALKQMDQANDLPIAALKKSVNTPYSEFAPFLQGDTLYYSSLRFDNKEDSHQPPRKISKVLYASGTSRGRPLPHNFNEKEKHTAHTSFSASGDRVYFTICGYQDKAYDIRCKIYFRQKDKRKRWGKAQELPETINVLGYTATQPQVIYDSLQAKELLYFVSDRPEGKGGLDIWYAILEKNGKIGEVKNLEAINTPLDELSPFYFTLSGTLFFSSNGYTGFGGYDIFQSRQSAIGAWSAPQNMGAPTNSSYNDTYYTVNSDSTIAHLASNREGSLHLDRKSKSCCNDIYRIDFPPPSLPTPGPDSSNLVRLPPKKDSLLTGIPPIVTSANPSKPSEPQTLEDFLPLALYFDNDEPDRRTRRTTTRKTYGETFDRYYAQKKTYVEEYSNGLAEDKQWEAEDRMESFFESEISQNREWLDRFSEILLKRLENKDQVEIFLKGFTSPRANSDYNLTLGQRRISSVRNHFYQYREGIFLQYLNSGQLKISERSFGETSADQTVSADLNDRRNSIYSIGAARERRVEIMEVKTEKFD